MCVCIWVLVSGLRLEPSILCVDRRVFHRAPACKFCSFRYAHFVSLVPTAQCETCPLRLLVSSHVHMVLCVSVTERESFASAPLHKLPQVTVWVLLGPAEYM